MEVLETPIEVVDGAVDPVLGLLDVLKNVQRAKAGLAALELELIESARRWAEAEAITSGASIDLAYRSFRSEAALALNLTERGVDLAMSTAYSLVGGLPATLAALHAGDISARHAEVMVRETTGLDPLEALDVEAQALGFASTLTVPKFERKVRTIRERRAPERAAERHATAVAERNVSLTAASDGMAWLNAYLPAPEAVAIFGRLDGAARAIHQGGDPRGVGQLRADIFAQAYLGGSAGGGSAGGGSAGGGSAEGGSADAGSALAEGLCERFRNIKPTVVLTVPIGTMAGTSTAPGDLEGYGPLDPDTCRELASWAPEFRRMITDPVKGIALDLDRTKYRPSADLRLWLRLRDRTCSHPGCNRRVGATDIDHTQEWDPKRAKGKTQDINLAHLCRGHHGLKHRMGWKLTQDPDGSGRLTWTTPRGRVYFREPEPPP